MIVSNKIPKYSIILNIITIFLLYNCNNTDWTKDRRNYFVNKCISEGKNILYDNLKLEEICECSIDKFTSEFSWSEYQDILNQEILSIDQNSRLNLIIELLSKECDIFYNSSTSFK